MPKIKGKVPVAVTLNKQNCYRLRTGRCSLDIVGDFELAAPIKIGPADLMYCPRLREIMRERERERRVAVTPCGCGHAETAAGAQKICVAEKLDLEVSILPSEADAKPLCLACGRQLTFEDDRTDREGAYLLEVRAVAQTETDN